VTTTATTLGLEPLSGLIGARVDVDLARLLAEPDLQDELRAAFLEHLVLVLPEADPTHEQHLALAQIFGEPEPPEDYNPAHPDHPDICVFDSAGGYTADKWHSDVTWKGVIPIGAVLRTETGRKLLFVNDTFTRHIVNLPLEESRAVLPFLIRHVARPEFTYRHTWSDGDVVIWDNRATQHYALNDYEERRIVERVQIKGTAPRP
jgi:alpha-ketoglutarate-dependent taurine dioxygenase